MSSIRFSITVTPDQLREIRGLPVTPAHLAYRMGQGPHLFRTGGSSVDGWCWTAGTLTVWAAPAPSVKR